MTTDYMKTWICLDDHTTSRPVARSLKRNRALCAFALLIFAFSSTPVPAEATNVQAKSIKEHLNETPEQLEVRKGKRIEGLQQAWDRFPLLTAELQSSPAALRVRLNTDPVLVDGIRYHGFRIKSGAQPADFIWAFQESAGMESWYIVPRDGSMPRGFTGELWFNYQLPDADRTTGHMQAIPRESFAPSSEYLLWFTFEAEPPPAIQVWLRFASLSRDDHGLFSTIDMAKALDRYPEFLSNLTSMGSKPFHSIIMRGGIGAQLQEQDGRVVVASINENSAAAAAGLKPGDIITEVGGRVIASSGMATPLGVAMYALRGDPGTTVALRVRRGSENISLSLTRRLISYPVFDNGEASRAERR